MKALPKTHLDLLRQLRPLMIAAAERRAARVAVERGDDLWALTTTEQIACGAREDFDAEIERFLEGAWQKTRLRAQRAGMSREDAIRQVVGMGEFSRFAGALAFDYANAFNMALFGNKTFFFSPELAARLAETELNVDAVLVQPPFRGCALVFNDPVARGALRALMEANPAEMRPGASSADVPERGTVTVYLSLVRHAEGRHLIVFAAQADERSLYVTAKRELLLRDGGRVEDALRTEWGTPAGGAGDATFYGPGLRLMRIVVNAILYLASSSPDVTGPLRAADRIPEPPLGASSGERKKRTQKVERASGLEYVEVGASYGPPDRELESESAGGRTVGTRFRVRGHWRWQAHGPGRSQRRLVFVEPFWKGPDMAEVVERPYIVR